jgi:predicted nucleic acid-binding protein
LSVIVDSSVVVAALVDSGPHGVWAEAILSGGVLQAPEMVLAEATNIFRRLERAKVIAAPEANAAQEDLMQLDIELFPFEPFAGRIWALRHNVTSYDAWYVAIAEALKLPLATLDESLTRANGVTCKFLTPGF